MKAAVVRSFDPPLEAVPSRGYADQVVDGSAPAPRPVFRVQPAATASTNGAVVAAIGTT